MGRVNHNMSSAPTFIADASSIERIPGGRQIDWANVDSSYQTTPGLAPVTIVVAVAGAAQGATSVPVAALSGPISSGAVISLGTNKFLRTTADAVAGAVTLAVAALPTALVSTDTGTWAGTVGSGSKVLKAGTPVGDLLHGSKVSPRILTTNPAIGLLETDCVENDPSAPLGGYSVLNGGNVHENLLPAAWLSGSPRKLATAVKNELNAAGVGSFKFFQYSDVR